MIPSSVLSILARMPDRSATKALSGNQRPCVPPQLPDRTTHHAHTPVASVHTALFPLPGDSYYLFARQCRRRIRPTPRIHSSEKRCLSRRCSGPHPIRLRTRDVSLRLASRIPQGEMTVCPRPTQVPSSRRPRLRLSPRMLELAAQPTSHPQSRRHQ